ncbi:DUF4003 family protein [Oceanobacillus halophilus]|uniref:DUF4003 domain-containing protein n=1 Tax=Oceanobacillus halophilus TaxID=930130 RepID=A0A494ZXN0_9BACI|nr:DUF4003 family protein [Oceanobacillus halophilus]RKQ31514.1 DUF4003 domain-containing protein [Oceanobacillus halophilus]
MYDNKVTDYIDIYEKLRMNMKWKVSDKRILMTIASIYVMNQKELDIKRFFEVADEIKRKASLFSSMKSHPRFTTGALLDVNFDHPKSEVSTLFHLYQAFRKVKFSSGTFTYMAASIVLTNRDRIQDSQSVIHKAKEIYDEMKKEHFFLTGTSDYPLAALLAFEERPDLISHIEHFYEELSKNGFSKGNDLQFLSHILSLDSDTSANQLINRSIEVSDSFKEKGIRRKRMYYPIIGMLSLLPKEECNMDTIIAVYDKLNDHIKWQKEMNLIIAVSLFINDKLEASGLAETSIYTTLETILQAQQAVMVSTMAAASASAATNGNN